MNNRKIIVIGVAGLAAVVALLLIIAIKVNNTNKAKNEEMTETSSEIIELDMSQQASDSGEAIEVIESESGIDDAITLVSGDDGSQSLEGESETGESKTGESEAVSSKVPDSAEGNTTIVSDTGPLAGLAAGCLLAPEVVGADYAKYFYYMPIPTEVYNSMLGKSYVENSDISIDSLKYVRVIHYNFNHEIQVGEIVVNQSIADDAVNIFRELYENEYEIQSMFLVDRYWTGDGDTTDYASIEVNNTSSFLYRKATGSSKLSKHAYGMAIDINPQQNPYVSYKTGSPVWSHSNADAYIDRTTGLAHVITAGDVCTNIFGKYGFSWGGNWKTIKDYQHFEK